MIATTPAPDLTLLTALPAILDEEAAALGESGFFVRDSFLGRDVALDVRKAIAHVEFRPAAIGRGDSGRLDARIRSDELAWLDDSPPPYLACLRARFEALRLAINHSVYLGLRRFDVQLGRYAGGGSSYAPHFDSFRVGSSRALTAICYLNPDWLPAHGGALRLRVTPTVDVEPRLDRLVVFLSERIEHEVLPTFAARYAATAWFYNSP